MKKLLIIALVVITMANCNSGPDSRTTRITVHPEIINDHYLGNGAQWDPYELNYSDGALEISDDDWQKLYRRLDFMKPRFMRVMTGTTGHFPGRRWTDDPDLRELKNILDYCQSRGVTVMLGDWSGGVDRRNGIQPEVIDLAARFVKLLVEDRGYDCIKYYNIVNEPNGWWSSTDGNYPLWASAVSEMQKGLETYGIADRVSIVGPDAAIWTTEETWWIDSCATHLNDIIDLYDIHTYPSKITVNSGEYSDIIKAYKDLVPRGHHIVMGEIGFKYLETADSLYDRENKRRIAAKEHASAEDSQMFVYDYMYGTDMADAIIQTINCGYSGCIVWMLDDAMHTKESRDHLKIWGFWNIMGDEKFGPEEEAIRPWYYAISLLCRYIPEGSKVRRVEVDGYPDIKAAAVEFEGKNTLAIVNVGKETRNINIDATGDLSGMKSYVYGEGKLLFDGEKILPNETDINLSHRENREFAIDPETLVLFTNIEP